MKNDSFDLYRTYLALKTHFKIESYDFFEYKGAVRTNLAAFNKRKDKYQFERLSRATHPKSVILANVSENPNVWIGKLFDHDGQGCYDNWAKFRLAYSYNLKSDLEKITTFSDIFRLFVRKEISRETICCILKFGNCLERFNAQLGNDPLWNFEHRLSLTKYMGFIPEKEKYSTLVLDKLQNL